jgi:hypothetical protein
VAESKHVWRAPLAYRILGGLGAVLMAGAALLPLNNGVVTFPLDDPHPHVDSMYQIVGLILAAVCVAWVCRARVDLRDDHLMLRYTLWSRRIPLREIANVTAVHKGLRFETRDGLFYYSPLGIGEKSFASWLHRHTGADSIAETIMRACPNDGIVTGAP